MSIQKTSRTMSHRLISTLTSLACIFFIAYLNLTSQHASWVTLWSSPPKAWWVMTEKCPYVNIFLKWQRHVVHAVLSLSRRVARNKRKIFSACNWKINSRPSKFSRRKSFFWLPSETGGSFCAEPCRRAGSRERVWTTRGWSPISNKQLGVTVLFQFYDTVWNFFYRKTLIRKPAVGEICSHALTLYAFFKNSPNGNTRAQW